MPLTKEGGKLRSVTTIVRILGKEELHDLGFDIPKSSKLTPQQAVMLNRAEEELPSATDVAKAGNIELQGIAKNAARSTEGLIEQFNDPLGDSLEFVQAFGLDKELRSIRGSLKVERVKGSVGRTH